jgi:hypothetical protein
MVSRKGRKGKAHRFVRIVAAILVPFACGREAMDRKPPEERLNLERRRRTVTY